MPCAGLKIAACALACATTAAHASQAVNVLRHSNVAENKHAEGFVRALEFQHRLRVCNAYPYSAALDVYRDGTERLTGKAPMAYKECRDFVSTLKEGDKLEFKVGDASAGTFSVSDLPSHDAVLLLVIHRHDTLSTAVAFESHVFANLMNAQVAVIDTYKGSARSTPRILDAVAAETPNKKNTVRSEELRYNSVVAVNPGRYEVELDGTDGEMKSKGELVALNHESYVILRTGVEAQLGDAYPQELVVYPRSAVALLHSGAASVAPHAVFLALMALLTFTAAQ
mmetsp:Transcript_3109/g.9750  ORF Transcript_3109/g.9750 Transcript_3109/m.9750 type:complete len:283 (-) Transcript_3109:109-957(-)